MRGTATDLGHPCFVASSSEISPKNVLFCKVPIALVFMLPPFTTAYSCNFVSMFCNKPSNMVCGIEIMWDPYGGNFCKSTGPIKKSRKLILNWARVTALRPFSSAAAYHSRIIRHKEASLWYSNSLIFCSTLTENVRFANALFCLLSRSTTRALLMISLHTSLDVFAPGHSVWISAWTRHLRTPLCHI